MKCITLHLPRTYIKMLDEAVALGLAPNRAVAIRDAIRDYLKAEGLWKTDGSKKVEVPAKLMDAILATKEG